MIHNTAPEAIQRKSLHQELVDRLQLLVISGELTPGAKVPEKTLCIRFGVSRTPLREALKVLASDGLVRLEPNRGAWATQVTIDEVQEVFPVLGALEALSRDVRCYDRAGVAHTFGYLRGLAARRAAQVEYLLPGLWLQEGDG